ncbi:phage tail assembly protein [Pseudoalteromonas sp. SCSIO 43201]|uniref:phage tail assembly protein n=1 Tax=Pseudoalteromonas sp. SCSIO 43201 TaxID=2822842 RepID=UPI002075A8F1|nr:phage tail assembly protein [Pseudoalteromonas sp. SCSIO 43201]USD30868.1 phage tail assembly protein [Pseudoalteromonas sp. SCSIO 43201]
MFKAKTHDLVWPIEDASGKPCKTVKVVTLTMGQHRELSDDHKGDDTALLRACICESTGLGKNELKKLVTPDYNSIQSLALELMQSPGSKLIDGKFNKDEPTLLVPFQGDDGREVTGYKLRPPTVATTDLMDSHNDEWERTLFISASCTGFSHTELERMSLPDWNQLQERLIDFLQKSADYFRQKTSKS